MGIEGRISNSYCRSWPVKPKLGKITALLCSMSLKASLTWNRFVFMRDAMQIVGNGGEPRLTGDQDLASLSLTQSIKSIAS